MKVAFHPGCVSKGACPELYVSATLIAEPLGLELHELVSAPCTGAGVLSEQNRDLADALNALTLAMAEAEGADLMTICSTCQGVLSDHNYHLKKRSGSAREGQRDDCRSRFPLRRNDQSKAYAVDALRGYRHRPVERAIKRKLTGLKIAPFYGCYILRPSEALGLRERPERKTYLNQLIALLGAEPVEYKGATKCCGFPMVTFNRDKALAMGGNHILEAKDKGADLLVTPCPLCHLNLDGQQPDASRVIKKDLGVPIFHLPQLLGLAFGFEPEQLRLNHHVVSTKGALEKVELKV